MVGIVVVSHSDTLAESVVRLAREMSPPELKLEAAGGIGEPGVLGTSAELIGAAIERAMSPDGVLVVMDLGSALMSAEFAVELLEGAAGPVRLSDAPLVEGTVAAAAAAGGGASLAEVAVEARAALAMKAAQIGFELDQPIEAAPVAAPVAAPADAEAELPVENEIGLHARPAARLVQTVSSFDADVRIAKTGGTAAPVGARSLTNIVALGARRGDRVIVSASGPQAHDVIAALEELAATGFGDGLGPPVAVPSPATVRPTSAPAAGTVLTGVGASAGGAVGAAHVLIGGGAPPPPRDPGTPAEELAALDGALAAARDAITQDREQLVTRGATAEAEIFDAHAALLDDEAILVPARTAIAAGANAERAYYDAIQKTADLYRRLPDQLLAERATDVIDVGRRVVAALTGDRSSERPPSGILVADELTPADSAGIDPALVSGIVSARGSATAHAAIIARSLGIPAVLGLGEAILSVPDGTMLLIDGESGSVTVAPSDRAVSEFQTERERSRAQATAALARAHEDGVLSSGERIEIAANIGSVDEATRAVEFGAEGVGLLRTEFLFLDRPRLPSEDEQAETLRQIAIALDGRPLIVRTLDAGADKPLPALPMPAEANPFLGVRGIRVGLLSPELLATQLRAILRVAAEYPVKVMLPMVATLAEIESARELLEQARAETGVSAAIELGIMVEVPAAALMAVQLAPHVDFFSIGTNDLTQYTMAAERGDARLAPLLASPQPAVLRLVRATVEAATARGRWVGVCGEMAGDPAAAMLLAGLGVTELSMAPGSIPQVKAVLRGVELRRARDAAAAALAATSAAEARALALELL